MAPPTRPRRPPKPLSRDALVSVIGEKPTALVNAVTTALAVRDPDAPLIADSKGNLKPDSTLRDNENAALPAKRLAFEADTTRRLNTVEYRSTIDDYLEAEVRPYVPDAWHDPRRPRSATKYHSPATSTPTPHPVPSKKSTPRSKPSKPRYRLC